MSAYEFAPHELELLKAAARTVDRLERLAEEEAALEIRSCIIRRRASSRIPSILVSSGWPAKPWRA